MEFTVSIIMIRVSHPKFKVYRFVSRKGSFVGRIIDAKRYSDKAEATQAALSLTNLWGAEGYTFSVVP